MQGVLLFFFFFFLLFFGGGGGGGEGGLFYDTAGVSRFLDFNALSTTHGHPRNNY